MAAVTLWVGGFDVLYACQDVEFDRQRALFDPKRFGIASALLIARAMHVGDDRCAGWLAGSFASAMARVGRHCAWWPRCWLTSIRS